MTDAKPATADSYAPTLPADFSARVTIAAAHPRFKAAQQAAHKAGLTQAQFSALLAHEAQNVLDVSKTKSARATPRAKIDGYDRMSFAQKSMVAMQRRKAKGT